jgi:hypothetical protein
MSDAEARTVIRRLVVLLVSVLLIQAVAAYGYRDLRVGGFFYGTFAARLGVPLLCAAFVLGMPWGSFGLAWPRLAPSQWLLALGATVVLTAVAIPLLDMDSYQAAYEDGRGYAFDTKVQRFLLFTVSTTIPWEILHRGYLLHGIRNALGDSKPLARIAVPMAILITMAYEVLFHFTKPPLEALALLVGSPILSWVALRSGSILLPLLVHLYIEGLYFWLVLA